MLPQLRQQPSRCARWSTAATAPTPEGMLTYEALIAAAEPVPDARRGGDDLAGVFYTGGTTGFPKGVMLPTRPVLDAPVHGCRGHRASRANVACTPRRCSTSPTCVLAHMRWPWPAARM